MTARKTQVFLTVQEVELLIAALDFLSAEISNGYCSAAHKVCGGFVQNRIVEMKEKLRGKKP